MSHSARNKSLVQVQMDKWMIQLGALLPLAIFRGLEGLRAQVLVTSEQGVSPSLRRTGTLLDPLPQTLVNTRNPRRSLDHSVGIEIYWQMRFVLIILTAFSTLFAGCSNSTRMLEIPEPPEVPFEVTWVNRHPDINDIFFVSQTTGWAVGDSGDVLYTQDGGAIWEPRAKLNGKRLRRLYFIDKLNGWMATEDHSGASSSGEVIATTDGGLNWSLPIKVDDEGANYINFVDKHVGWVVFEQSILATTDGGATWIAYKFPDSFFCEDAHFVDTKHGWAVGKGGVVATRDGGVSWTLQKSGVEDTLSSVFFLDKKTGWAAKRNGVLWTEDGGETWNLPQSETNTSFKSLQFINAQTGWAASNDGMILRTMDGGKTWTDRKLLEHPDDPPDFRTLYFVSESKGWCASKNGAIFTSDDGGKIWRRQNEFMPPAAYAVDASKIKTGKPYDRSASAEVMIPQAQCDNRYYIKQYLFANKLTGWAIGSHTDSSEGESEPILFSTTDGGKTWSLKYLGDNESGLSSLQLVDNNVLVVFTRYITYEKEVESLLWGTPSRRAPSLKGFRAAENQAGGIILQWQVRDEDIGGVSCTRLEFSQGTDKNFGGIDLAGLKINEDGSFSISIRPADYGIFNGAQVFYRVTLDNAGLRYTHQVPEPFVYRPWWARQHPLTKSFLGAAAIVAVYYSLSYSILLVFPIGLLWVERWLPIDEVAALVPVPGIKSVLGKLFDSIGPRYFSTHERVRKVWLAGFQAHYATLTALPQSLQQAFLRHDDVCTVWLTHYMEGLCTFADLPVELQPEYLRRPACLDAWVEVRTRKAVEAYGRLDSVRQRGIFIQLPVRVGGLATGDYLSNPDCSDFRALMESPVSVLAILGEGGTGKSTLAFQLGRWALSDHVEMRLASHRMIPIVVEEETSDLMSTVHGVLKQMVAPDDITDDLLKCLLAYKRVLVIIDGFSERALDTQRNVSLIHRHEKIGALVITSRKRPDFGAIDVTEMWPEKVTNTTIFYFVTQYLRRSGVAELFPGRTALELGERLISVFESSNQGKQITPLFVTIFVDQAVDLRRKKMSLEYLPVSLAETVIEYLRRTNPQDPGVPNRIATDTLIWAAKILGNCSLMPHFVPRDFFRADGEQALNDNGITPAGAYIIQRLIDNGVLEERDRGGTRILRFVLDPIAEYTAALYRLDKLRNRQKDWDAWTDEVLSTEGYPKEMMGFLIALENCISTYKNDLQIPALNSALNASELLQAMPSSV